MDLDNRLRRYREGRFADEDVTRCAGLSVRAWRELLKIGAVRTIAEGRGPGRIRRCDATTFKRTAVIAAINAAGFSLAVAGRLAYFLPFEELLFAIWDPFTVLFLHDAADDPQTGLPPKRKPPQVDWFDPDTPAKVDSENDWFIRIYDGRFIAGDYRVAGKPNEAFIYGDLRDAGATFVSWLAFDERRPVFDDRLKSFVDKFDAKWLPPNPWSDRLDPILDYKYERHDAEYDLLRRTAETASHSPICEISINITLALRKALRRYLGIEPMLTQAESEDHEVFSKANI
jgi:hypothetical protein